MSRRKRTPLDMGHDAFLDIVANLVGILIILVVVLGAQSQAVPETDVPPVPEVKSASPDQLGRLGQLAMRAASAQRDSNRFERTIDRYQTRLENTKRTRDQLLDLTALAEAAWEEKQSELDQQRVAAAKLQTELAENRELRKTLAGRKQALENVDQEIIELTHLPTPMAKTVFGDEIHLRLKDNRLSVVPIERLIDLIKGDVRTLAKSRGNLADGSVGPIRDYVARYAMKKRVARMRKNGRVGTGVYLSLAGIVFKPSAEPHGQPIDQVLGGGNLLDIELAGRDPGATTITVWVYPESFAAFRDLKAHLYQRGFATAARPLRAGDPIAGSPSGSRSDAQ